MKRIKLIALSLCGLLASRQAGLCTANGVADDLEAFKKEVSDSQAAAQTQIDTLLAQNAALQKQVNDAKAAASKVETDEELNLGGLRLPEGLDKKDVLWRKRAGLDLKQAVAAAIAQKNHDDAVKKAAGKK